MEIKNLLKDKSGKFSISTLFIALILMTIGCAIFEYSRLQIITQGVRNAVQSAVIETCEENYADIYNGVREGYSGGYQLKNGDWTENISVGDVYNRIDARLKTVEQGGYHVKHAGKSIEYQLSGLSAQMTNAPFAPADPDRTDELTCSAVINLDVPLSFGWEALPPMHTRLTLTAGYIPKF